MQVKSNCKTMYTSRPPAVEVLKVGDLAVVSLTENVTEIIGKTADDDDTTTTYYQADEYTFDLDYAHDLQSQINQNYDCWLTFAKQNLPKLQPNQTQEQRIADLESITDMLIINALEV